MKTDLRGVNGRDKAAILMLAIGEENAAKMFALMDEEEIKEISQSMATLGTVNAELVEGIFVEFTGRI